MSVALVRPSRPPVAASRRRRTLALAVITTLVATLLAAVQAAPAQAAPVLLSQGSTVTASSQENGGTAAGNAVDGDGGTRWSSAFADPQWIRIDLGSPAALSRVELAWEAAHAKSYRIELSTDGDDWTTAYSTTTSAGGDETLNISGDARYVRLTGTERATGYGYSLWEFKVFGTRDGGGGPRFRAAATSVRTSMSSTRPRRTSRARSTRSSSSRGGPVRQRPARAPLQAGHVRRHQRADRLLHPDRRSRPQPERHHVQR